MKREYSDRVGRLYEMLVEEREQVLEQIEVLIKDIGLDLVEHTGIEDLLQQSMACAFTKQYPIFKPDHPIDLNEVDVSSVYFDDLIDVKAALIMALRVCELNKSNLDGYTATAKSFMSLITNKVVPIDALTWMPDYVLLFELKRADLNEESNILRVEKNYTRIGLSGKDGTCYFTTMFMLCSLYDNSRFYSKPEINLMCDGIELICDQLAIYNACNVNNNERSIRMNGRKYFQFIFQEKIWELLCMTENGTDNFNLNKLNITFEKDTSGKCECELNTTREMLNYLKRNILNCSVDRRLFSLDWFYRGMCMTLLKSYEEYHGNMSNTRAMDTRKLASAMLDK